MASFQLFLPYCSIIIWLSSHRQSFYLSINRFFCKKINSCLLMRSHKRLPSPKFHQLSMEDPAKEEFFDMLMGRIDNELTPEEHEFLMSLFLHNRMREKALQADHATRNPRPSLPSKHDDSPLHHVREDLFAEVKRTPKRVATLTEVLNMTQQPSSTPINSTARKKTSEGKMLFRNIFTRQERRKPSSPVKISRKETAKDRHFKIYPIRKNKYTDSKSFEILKDKKVIQTYDSTFLNDVFGDDSFIWPQEVNQRYLFNVPNQSQNVTIYDNLRSRQRVEENKLQSINSLQFDKIIPRKRTAIKLHCRKY